METGVFVSNQVWVPEIEYERTGSVGYANGINSFCWRQLLKYIRIWGVDTPEASHMYTVLARLCDQSELNILILRILFGGTGN